MKFCEPITNHYVITYDLFRLANLKMFENTFSFLMKISTAIGPT